MIAGNEADFGEAISGEDDCIGVLVCGAHRYLAFCHSDEGGSDTSWWTSKNTGPLAKSLYCVALLAFILGYMMEESLSETMKHVIMYFTVACFMAGSFLRLAPHLRKKMGY